MPDSALVIIDVQNGVLDGCPDADGVVARINDLSRKADEEGVPVIFIQHEDEELVKGSREWQLAEGLERPGGAFTVEKTYRDGFGATELEERLRSLGAGRLVVTGAHSDWCVQTTALSALVRGFDVVLVRDGHTTVPSPDDPALTGEALTAHVNARMATLRHPERTVEVLSASEVEF